MDLYSRRLIGWFLSERMTTKLFSEALIMALWNREMPKEVMVHPD